VAATARNGGFLQSAEDLMEEEPPVPYHYDDAPYQSRVYQGAGKPDPAASLRYGPNITDWPDMDALGEDLLLKIVAFITDPVTTTDELIPSGDTSSFRSNPLALAEYTLSRKDPAYVGRAKAVQEAARQLSSGGRAAGIGRPVLSSEPAIHKAASDQNGKADCTGQPAFSGESVPYEAASGGGGLEGVLEWVQGVENRGERDLAKLRLGSAIYARRPGDGSAREQAASCQRVLGGLANFAGEYATKRYRSNLINWGILPFTVEGEPSFKNGDYVFIPGIARAVREGSSPVRAYVLGDRGITLPFTLKMPELSPVEREIVLEGCLINYNRRLLKERS
jgi:aconitate hydratase